MADSTLKLLARGLMLGVGVLIMGDSSHINLLLENLITNSKQALEGKIDGEIKVKCDIEDSNNALVLTVTDNGCGIQDESIDKIFDPFFSTKPDKGIGLGLNKVKRISDLYHGKITVESVPNKFTTFKVIIPI